MRDAYQLFRGRGAEILAVGPDSSIAFGLYWRAEKLPFVGLPDPGHKVALCYRQQVNLLKLGRMPLMTVIDRNGLIRYAHYATSMSDIPEEQSLLDVIDQLNGEPE